MGCSFSKKNPGNCRGFCVLFGSLSLSVSPQKTPGQYTGTTASAGTFSDRFKCHAVFLSMIKSGAIWQKIKTLSTTNFIFPNHDSSCFFAGMLSLLSETPDHRALQEKSNNTAKSEARNFKRFDRLTALSNVEGQSPMTQIRIPRCLLQG
jgi:hypothetical protein